MPFLLHPLLITIGLLLTYTALLHLLPRFFRHTNGSLKNITYTSIILIISGSILAHLLSMIIPDPAGNRLLHFLGGGVLSSFVCYAASKDTKVNPTKFQFFTFTVLIVTTLGVANEIAEYVLQNTGILISTVSINDVWLDLISNTLGTLLASTLLTPLIKWTNSPTQEELLDYSGASSSSD